MRQRWHPAQHVRPAGRCRHLQGGGAGLRFFRGVPHDLNDVQAELAFVFHWPPSVLDELTMDEMAAWHAQAVRLMKKFHGAT
ncbi:GpE family phage tail protein [Roseateles sp. DXS20W]|uniref:GpE family phage tail protein n=1 Tax=Pelomonas lactea TaxID=3299030 RepID=A0ABW7GJX4_9BURK